MPMTPRILVADDEPSIVMAVQDELVFEGFEVHAAANGPDALAKARAIRPDVLLLDLMLPGRVRVFLEDLPRWSDGCLHMV